MFTPEKTSNIGSPKESNIKTIQNTLEEIRTKYGGEILVATKDEIFSVQAELEEELQSKYHFYSISTAVEKVIDTNPSDTHITTLAENNTVRISHFEKEFQIRLKNFAEEAALRINEIRYVEINRSEKSNFQAMLAPLKDKLAQAGQKFKVKAEKSAKTYLRHMLKPLGRVKERSNITEISTIIDMYPDPELILPTERE